MSLQEQIAANPYLKVSNCTDVADLDFGMDALRKLDIQFPGSKVLLSLWGKFLAKKEKFTN